AAPQFWQTKERVDLAMENPVSPVLNPCAAACQDISSSTRRIA
ncbi:MAG: hypothetical protein V7632_3937, partial [Bradyrhizobium sp.]